MFQCSHCPPASSSAIVSKITWCRHHMTLPHQTSKPVQTRIKTASCLTFPAPHMTIFWQQQQLTHKYYTLPFFPINDIVSCWFLLLSTLEIIVIIWFWFLSVLINKAFFSPLFQPITWVVMATRRVRRDSETSTDSWSLVEGEPVLKMKKNDWNWKFWN